VKNNGPGSLFAAFSGLWHGHDQPSKDSYQYHGKISSIAAV